jgi:hypothetical protein
MGELPVWWYWTKFQPSLIQGLDCKEDEELWYLILVRPQPFGIIEKGSAAAQNPKRCTEEVRIGLNHWICCKFPC